MKSPGSGWRCALLHETSASPATTVTAQTDNPRISPPNVLRARSLIRAGGQLASITGGQLAPITGRVWRCRTRERRSRRRTTPAAATTATTHTQRRTGTANDGDRTEAKSGPRGDGRARKRGADRAVAMVVVVVFGVVRVLAEVGLSEEDGTGEIADVAAADVEERRRIVALIRVLDRIHGQPHQLGRERLGEIGGEAGMDRETTVGRDVAHPLAGRRGDRLGSGRGAGPAANREQPGRAPPGPPGW